MCHVLHVMIIFVYNARIINTNTSTKHNINITKYIYSVCSNIIHTTHNSALKSYLLKLLSLNLMQDLLFRRIPLHDDGNIYCTFSLQSLPEFFVF